MHIAGDAREPENEKIALGKHYGARTRRIKDSDTLSSDTSAKTLPWLMRQ